MVFAMGTLMGCGVDDPCQVLCERDVECGYAPEDYLDDCISQCEQFSAEDTAYAEAVEDRAACYESQDDCDSVVFSCFVSGE